MPAEAASGPNHPGGGTESVAANLSRLEGALKRLSWLATMRVAPAQAPSGKDAGQNADLVERDRLAAALQALQADHDRLQQDHNRLLADHAELERQRQDLGQRLETAIERLRALIPGDE